MPSALSVLTARNPAIVIYPIHCIQLTRGNDSQAPAGRAKGDSSPDCQISKFHLTSSKTREGVARDVRLRMEGSLVPGFCHSAYSSLHPGNNAGSFTGASRTPIERPCDKTRSTQSFPRPLHGACSLLVAASITQVMDADWPGNLEPLPRRPPQHTSSSVPDRAYSSPPGRVAGQDADRAKRRAFGGALDSCGSKYACGRYCSVDREASATVTTASATKPSSSPRTVQRVLLADRRNEDAVQKERQQLQQWLARNAVSVKQLEAICATSTWGTGTASHKPLPPPAFRLLESYL